MELKKIIQYYGKHAGFTFEIHQWSYDLSDFRQINWNYYVYLSKSKIKQEYWDDIWLAPETVRLDTLTYTRYPYESSMLSDVYWHGGITSYVKDGGIDHLEQQVKAGCDFMHYWDEGNEYTLEYVTSEAVKTIDGLQFLLKCPEGDGK